jgi:hypothetical protein
MDTLRFTAVSRDDSYAALAAYRTLASEDSIVVD